METNQQSKNTIAWIGLVIMTLLSGVLGFMYFDQKKLAEAKEVTILDKAKELAFTQTRLDSVSRSLDERIAEVQKLGGNVEELLQVKARLEADKAALRKSNNFEIAKYNTKIKEYEQFLTEKDVEIAKLKEENGVLVASNQTLTNENGTLKVEKEELSKTKAALTDSVVSYTAKTRELSEKVAIGAALKAENVRVLAVSPKGKVKEDDKYRSKRVDKLKVQFTLPANPLTAKEEKEIVVRVLDPNGAVLSDDAVGSGKFNWKGQDMVFTTKNRIAYQGDNQLVEMIYDNPQQLRSGTYNIELYAEGFKIGSGNFVIR